jgi:hypothetical protein
METISLKEKYKPYDDAVYRPLLRARSDDLLEEGLANSWMFREQYSDSEGIGDDVLAGLTDFLHDWIPTMPFAYGRGIDLYWDFESHLYDLTEQLRSGRQRTRDRRQLWRVTTHLLDPLHNRRSPHYIVVRRGQAPYLPHVPGPPRALSLTNLGLERCFVQLGWTRQFGGGPHPVKMVKGRQSIGIPRHPGDMPIGTLNAIAKQAGFANIRELRSACGA